MPKRKAQSRRKNASAAKRSKAKQDIYAVEMTPAEPDSEPLAKPMCSICHEDIDKCHGVVLRDCRHKFHRPCIERWVLTNNSCPMCRAERPQIVSMPTHKSFRYSSVIDTHVFPEMRVLEVRKLTDKKYTLTLMSTDKEFWKKMDEFDRKMRNTFMANPQWFYEKDPKYHERFMSESVRGRDSDDGTRGYVRVKVLVPRKDFFPNVVYRRYDFGQGEVFRFEGSREVRATCTVRSKIWMWSGVRDMGGVHFEATDLQMSYKVLLDTPAN